MSKSFTSFTMAGTWGQKWQSEPGKRGDNRELLTPSITGSSAKCPNKLLWAYVKHPTKKKNALKPDHTSLHYTNVLNYLCVA